MADERMVVLDMDGVLCDFVAGVAHLFRVEREKIRSIRCWEDIGKQEDDFWDTIDKAGFGLYGFWHGLPALPWASRLVAAAKEGGARVLAASNPGTSPWAHVGKPMWLRDHFPDIDFCLCSDKSILARTGRLLVDDFPQSVKAWRLKGGHALLFPQPWNGGEPVEDAIADVIEAVRAW